MNDQLRQLPAVGQLVQSSDGAQLVTDYGHTATVNALRHILDTTREHIRNGEYADTAPDALIQLAAQFLEHDSRPSLRPVINATGVIIHTNLGRAPLSVAAREAMQGVALGYSNLEFDLEAGGRGSRTVHPERLLTEITGAEAALVVNNAASALMLTLAALAVGKEVIVSRGQAVEIGGGFRIPDIMGQSGAHLVEIGTTNKTRPDDYRRALTDSTAIVLRVHASNFKQIGFTQSVELDTLADITAQHPSAYLVDDLGSGALLDTAQFGITPEPMVQDSVAAGADVILFSGDKLLGGPQAGVIVGKKRALDLLKRHPLARAVRADKLALSALLATLEHYRRGEALQHVPVWWMMARPLDELQAIAHGWAQRLGGEAISGYSTVGGGSIPGSTLETCLLALDVPHPTTFAHTLRMMYPPVISRIAEGRVLFDPRTVLPEQAETLLTQIEAALA